MPTFDRPVRTSGHVLSRAFLIFLLLSLLTTGYASAQTEEDLEARNREAVQKSFDAWSQGTGSPYDLLADGATWTIAGNSAASRRYTSREDFIANVIRPFVARMAKPLVPTINRLYADGDSVVVHFDAEGTARDGQPYRNTYAWFLQLRDGKIVDATAFFDSIAFNDLWSRVTPTP